MDLKTVLKTEEQPAEPYFLPNGLKNKNRKNHLFKTFVYKKIDAAIKERNKQGLVSFVTDQNFQQLQ